MSSMSEETDPSETRAAARSTAASLSQSPSPSLVTFNRIELNRILNLYGRMVADGEWRDYAIDRRAGRAVDPGNSHRVSMAVVGGSGT